MDKNNRIRISVSWGAIGSLILVLGLFVGVLTEIRQLRRENSKPNAPQGFGHFRLGQTLEEVREVSRSFRAAANKSKGMLGGMGTNLPDESPYQGVSEVSLDFRDGASWPPGYAADPEDKLVTISVRFFPLAFSEEESGVFRRTMWDAYGRPDSTGTKPMEGYLYFSESGGTPFWAWDWPEEDIRLTMFVRGVHSNKRIEYTLVFQQGALSEEQGKERAKRERFEGTIESIRKGVR